MSLRVDPSPLSYAHALKTRVPIRAAAVPKRIEAVIIDISTVFMVFAVCISACVSGLLLGVAAKFPWQHSGKIDVWLRFLQENEQIAIVRSRRVEIAVGLATAYVITTACYFFWHEALTHTTPGKRLVGLRVLDIDGARPSILQILARSIFRIIETVLLLPCLLCMLMNIYGRRIGDLVSSTLVVYAPAREHFLDGLYLRREDFKWLSKHLTPRPLKRHPYEDPRLHDFLTQAFALFVLCEGADNVALHAELAAYVDDRLSGPEKSKIAEDLRIRFYAEFVSQQTRADDYRGGAS